MLQNISLEVSKTNCPFDVTTQLMQPQAVPKCVENILNATSLLPFCDLVSQRRVLYLVSLEGEKFNLLFRRQTNYPIKVHKENKTKINESRYALFGVIPQTLP